MNKSTLLGGFAGLSGKPGGRVGRAEQRLPEDWAVHVAARGPRAGFWVRGGRRIEEAYTRAACGYETKACACRSPAKFASFARFRIMLSTPILPDILSMRMFLSADAEW